MRKTEFHQLPYHRIIIMLFIELNAPEAILDTLNYDIIQTFWCLLGGFSCDGGDWLMGFWFCLFCIFGDFFRFFFLNFFFREFFRFFLFFVNFFVFLLKFFFVFSLKNYFFFVVFLAFFKLFNSIFLFSNLFIYKSTTSPTLLFPPQQRPPHSETLKSSWLLLCLAGGDLTSGLHRTRPRLQPKQQGTVKDGS